MALEPGTLLDRRIRFDDGDDRGGHVSEWGVVLGKGEVNHAHLSDEFLIFIEHENMGEHLPTFVQRPETLSRFLNAAVDVHHWELGRHQGTRHVWSKIEGFHFNRVVRNLFPDDFPFPVHPAGGHAPQRLQNNVRANGQRVHSSEGLERNLGADLTKHGG